MKSFEYNFDPPSTSFPFICVLVLLFTPPPPPLLLFFVVPYTKAIKGYDLNVFESVSRTIRCIFISNQLCIMQTVLRWGLSKIRFMLFTGVRQFFFRQHFSSLARNKHNTNNLFYAIYFHVNSENGRCISFDYSTSNYSIFVCV